MTVEPKRAEGIDRLVSRCAASLEALYITCHAAAKTPPNSTECTRYVIRMLATLLAAERIPPGRPSHKPLRRAAKALLGVSDDSNERSRRAYERALRKAYRFTGIGLFARVKLRVPAEAFSAAVSAFLRPSDDSSIESLFFETMPLFWLGSAYQGTLAYRPSGTGEGLERSRTRRKSAGVYFTPPNLVSYILSSVLGRGEGSFSAFPRILDPAMGGGDFLCGTIDYLMQSAAPEDADQSNRLRAELAAECVYGVDVDPVAVEISRFCVWASSGFADGVPDRLNSHLICANALQAANLWEESFDWRREFPEVFAGDPPGFDAVVGNPPYIASKNGLTASGRSGQSDSYLLFLSAAMDNDLVRPGGMLSMVLPDPMLVRANAAHIRRKLITDWTVESILHVSGAFPDAMVANAVPVCRNAHSDAATFQVSRIDRTSDRHSFALRPEQTASELAQQVRTEAVLSQARCEFLYLLEEGPFGDIIRRIHGDRVSLSTYQPPFVPLEKLNIGVIYRGEEVGKAAITRETGDLPMLLGGQSIRPYEIHWEGRKVNLSAIRKPVFRYLSTKILIQKSSPRLIAALDEVSEDHQGYVFPQSVYGIELREPGMHEVYLLCLLNSEVLNEYIWRAVTGYKLIQPQLEIEDLRALPIRRVSFTTDSDERQAETWRGIDIFEAESLRADHSLPFSGLGNFVLECLAANPERSDVVHDILVHIGGVLSHCIRTDRVSPSSENARLLQAARAAIEIIVWRLYSSEPSQMSLTW